MTDAERQDMTCETCVWMRRLPEEERKFSGWHHSESRTIGNTPTPPAPHRRWRVSQDAAFLMLHGRRAFALIGGKAVHIVDLVVAPFTVPECCGEPMALPPLEEIEAGE